MTSPDKKLITLQDLNVHVSGSDPETRHDAQSIHLNPSLSINGEISQDVQSALTKLNNLIQIAEVPHATATDFGVVRLSGDLSPDSILSDTIRVTSLQSYPVVRLQPFDGYVLTWVDEEGWWEPKPPSTTLQYATAYDYGIVRLSDGFYPGDIGGTAGHLTIRGLQDYPLDLQNGDNPVYTDQFLKFDGISWVNSYLPHASDTDYGTVILGSGNSDIGGSAEALQLVGIQGRPLDADCPNDGDVITYNESTDSWVSSPLPCASSEIKGVIKLQRDIGGTCEYPEVVGFWGNPLDSSMQTPNNGDIPIYYSGEAGNFWMAASINSLVSCASSTDRGTVRLSNDLGGSCDNPEVRGLYGVNLSSSMQDPDDGSIVLYSSFSNAWLPTSLDSILNISGDLTGNSNSQRVIGWNAKILDGAFSSPSDGDVPVFDISSNTWKLSQVGKTLLGNPLVRTYYNDDIRNTSYRYQYSATSTNSSAILFSYKMQENTSLVLTGKIIGRVKNYIVPEDPPIFYTPSPLSSQDKPKLGFDLDSPLYDGYTFYYDIEVGYTRIGNVIHQLLYYSTGENQKRVEMISSYPLSPSISEDINLIYPEINLIDDYSFQIVTGYAPSTIIDWTLDLEIRENGV